MVLELYEWGHLSPKRKEVIEMIEILNKETQAKIARYLETAKTMIDAVSPLLNQDCLIALGEANGYMVKQFLNAAFSQLSEAKKVIDAA